MRRKAETKKPNGVSKTHNVCRCAIYTRKSSEEGLEQDFNSLDAQRESCEAYILSQKGDGWIALPAMYDPSHRCFASPAGQWMAGFQAEQWTAQH